MSRFRAGLAVVAITMTALAVPSSFTAGGGVGVANAAPIPGGDIRTVCASVGTDNPATSTFTLTADCGEVTSPLTVPDGYTVEGGGHIITATDPVGVSFNGGVVTNAQGPGAHLMHVNNVIIEAVGFAEHGCAFPPGGPGVQVGLFFDDADGTATDVIVRNITQHSGCQTGNGIRANARAGIARTVTLTHVTVTGFQKNGVTGSGQMTLNVGGNSTIGPPDALPGLNTTNGVQYGDGGAGGTFTGNTVIGAGAGTPPDGTNSTGILLSSAANVTIANNTITGAGTDLGIAVSNSTNVTISNNAVGRTAPDSPDPTGTGIEVFPSSTNVALICNTFSGWQPNKNIVGAVQMSCTPLPNGTECTTYSADIFSVQGGTAPFTWSVSAGTLPPGLTLAPSTGAITGTLSDGAEGTYNFTVRVVDSTQPTLTATQAQTITIAPGCAQPPPPTIDLQIQKADSPNPVNVGGTLTYTLTARNNGPSTATQVVITDSLPTTVTYLSSSSTQGTCSRSGQLVTCAIGTMAAGATVTVTIRVRPLQPGTILNTTQIVGAQAETNTANNRDEEPTQVRSVRRVVMCLTVSTKTLRVGKQSTIRAVVTRPGKRVPGARVVANGAGIRKSGVSDKQGVVRISVKPARVGNVQLRITGQPGSCATKRIGVLAAVKRPPFTG